MREAQISARRCPQRATGSGPLRPPDRSPASKPASPRPPELTTAPLSGEPIHYIASSARALHLAPICPPPPPPPLRTNVGLAARAPLVRPRAGQRSNAASGGPAGTLGARSLQALRAASRARLPDAAVSAPRPTGGNCAQLRELRRCCCNVRALRAASQRASGQGVRALSRVAKLLMHVAPPLLLRAARKPHTHKHTHTQT